MPLFEENIAFIFNATKRLNSKWTTQIVYTIMQNGVLRFKELEKKIEGINIKVLISELKSLDANGIVNRVVFAEVPSRVEYSLTEKGQDLVLLYQEILNYSKKYIEDETKLESIKDEKEQSRSQVFLATSLAKSKWSIPIIYSLFTEKKRFKDLERSVQDISTRMLTKELLSLEKNNLISRISFAETPPRVEYSLTEKGQALHKIFLELILFSKKYPD